MMKSCLKITKWPLGVHSPLQVFALRLKIAPDLGSLFKCGRNFLHSLYFFQNNN